MDIDLLCKVVDNYGDIGVVYRLARSLSELPEPPRLRLVVDNLDAFASLDPSIDAQASTQSAHGWEVYAWGGPGSEGAARAFAERRPRIVIEAFACGRPDWLEEIVFDGSGEPCLILDLEHLTAESWAADFHRMPSLTRSPLVRKAMFLPGFAQGTGGLILDATFLRSVEAAASPQARSALRGRLLEGIGDPAPGAPGLDRPRPPAAKDLFWVSIFSYERDFGPVVADLAAFNERRPLLAFAAAGRSQACVSRAWTEAGRPFPLVLLPFLPQQGWDRLLLACDFSIVRGEDSWSRAALSGRPFLWQAYPQEGRHHLVKVRAFLDSLRPHFPLHSGGAAFAALESLYLSFNDRLADGAGEAGAERLLPVLDAHAALLTGFTAFSASLAGMPDLASSLVTFLGEIV